MDRFAQMTGHEYQLLGMLRGGSIGVEYLKKYLDDGEGEEVNATTGGTTGAADSEFVRADSADSAHLNVEDGAEEKTSEGREDDDGVTLGETDGSELMKALNEAGDGDAGDETMLGTDGEEASKVDGANGDACDSGAGESGPNFERVDMSVE